MFMDSIVYVTVTARHTNHNTTAVIATTESGISRLVGESESYGIKRAMYDVLRRPGARKVIESMEATEQARVMAEIARVEAIEVAEWEYLNSTPVGMDEYGVSAYS